MLQKSQTYDMMARMFRRPSLKALVAEVVAAQVDGINGPIDTKGFSEGLQSWHEAHGQVDSRLVGVSLQLPKTTPAAAPEPWGPRHQIRWSAGRPPPRSCWPEGLRRGPAELARRAWPSGRQTRGRFSCCVMQCFNSLSQSHSLTDSLQ